jgi:hypothetical protein
MQGILRIETSNKNIEGVLMIANLRQQFPAIPEPVLWKTDLMFRGVRYTPELTDAVSEGAAVNFWPYTRQDAELKTIRLSVPYLFRLRTGSVARVRVDDTSTMRVQRDPAGQGFSLWDEEDRLCPIEFVEAHSWHSFRTSDDCNYYEAGVEQLGDMLVVNVTPGCEYHRVKDDAGHSMKCGFCAYGRFGLRSVALGQIPGVAAPDPVTIRRLVEVLKAATASGQARHVYITGGSLLDPEFEADRYVPIIEACRAGVGNRLTVTCGSGAVDKEHSQRYRDAGADSCCYNMEAWDPLTFAAAMPGKSHFVGRDRWIESLLGAVDVFGRGRVASAFVAGLELMPPGRGMTGDEMVASLSEGAAFLLDQGIMPVYSPLWPVSGTAYRPDQGLQPDLYLRLEMEIYKLRHERDFPVPSWLTCTGCSYMMLEVDFDREFGLAPGATVHS